MTAPVPVTDETIRSFKAAHQLCGEPLVVTICDALLAARVTIAALREAKGALEAGAEALHYRNRVEILDDKMRLRNMDDAATLRALAEKAP